MSDQPVLLTEDEVRALGGEPADLIPVGFYYPECRFNKQEGQPLFRSDDICEV